MADIGSPPPGYQAANYRHPNGQPCPATGSAAPVVIFVPINKTNFRGVTCSACKQQMAPA